MKSNLLWIMPGLLVLFAPVAAGAQYPSKPVRLILSVSAGGPGDTVARITGLALSHVLAQPVVIDNRPGADGAIAVETVFNSAPDGYTLLWGNSSAVIGVPLVHKNRPYDPVTSFTPVSFIGRTPLFLFAYPNIPARTLSDLIEYARANPGTLNYGTTVFADVVAAAQLMKVAGISMTRVAYKGAQQKMPDLVAGRIQLAIAPGPAGLPYVNDGRLRALAVFLPQRSPVAANVPTMAEAGIPGVSFSSWSALFGPAKMPKEIVDRLSRELNVVLLQTEVRAKFDQQGFQSAGSSPQALGTYVKEEYGTWKQIVRELALTQQ